MRLLSLPLLLTLTLASGWAAAQQAPAETAEAQAAEPNQKELARQLYEEGSRLYDAADYAGAIVAFEKAYAAYPAAALLFNLAQAHRLLGPEHCEQALDYYERYRQAPESASDANEVQVHIAEMRGCVRAAQASAQQRPVEPAKAVAPAPAPPPAEPARERPIPTAAYVLGGIGVAGLAAFGTLAILGRNQQNELERTCSPQCNPDRVQSMKTKFLLADVGLAVFAVSLGGAGYMVLSRPSVSPSAQGAQLDFVGRF
jgi:tetratricopeptide (TPR) repeat protein